MRKTFAVAVREFMSTVATKGFIIGVFLPPILMTLAFSLMPILMNKAVPKVEGRIAVIDQTGQLGDRLTQGFSAESLGDRFEKRRERMVKATSTLSPLTPDQQKMVEASIPKNPTISLELLPAGSDVDEAKLPLRDVDAKASANSGANPRLAVAVLPEGTLQRGEGGGFGGYELFVASKLDPEVQDVVRDIISDTVVDARLALAGLDGGQVRSIMSRPNAETKDVTKDGERKSSEIAAILIPVAFMFLLWISVFTGGQYLLMSTVEEKSSRVMEVLLSAVSPLQLMVGKIFGQMSVAGVILIAYAALGVGSLTFFKQDQLVSPMLLVYLVIFFLIAFFLIAAMMAAIGSAVNDMKEAQALLTPVMIILIIPMMLWMPISRNPNSMFAQVCSFIPPISPFIMVLRLAGSEPVPTWQIPASIAVGVLASIFAAWAAAKIFRIGVLMYGKPPNFRTLVRWIRMA